MPEVSVVMPVYNAAETVRRAVQSILEQTLGDLELVIVDDGSTDATIRVVESFGDSRIRMTPCSHRGVVAAANRGTELSRAPLIARMDADDFAHPQRIEKQQQLLLGENLDVVGCQVRILNQQGQPIKSMARYQRWINEETVAGDQIEALRFVEFPLVNPTILARRRYFELGFRNLEVPEDYDLMLRAAAAKMRFGKAPEILFDWFDSPHRLTRRDSRYTSRSFAACRQTHLLNGPLQHQPQVDLWGLGKTGKPWLRWLQAQGIQIRRGYEVNVRKIGIKIHDVPVVHADTLPAADGTPLLIAVGAESARRVILPQIRSQGYVPGRDAWFVA